MSRTFELACHDCEVALWVGQGNPGNEYIYKNEEHILALQKFLFDHRNHTLEFGDDEYFDYQCIND